MPALLMRTLRADCRAYLTAQVVPSLRQGLLELVAAVERQRIELAAGAQWDEDGFLPPHWAPFSPLRSVPCSQHHAAGHLRALDHSHWAISL